MKHLRCTISKLIHGGYGLARSPDGLPLMIRQALPGETVTARVAIRKKQYAIADLVEVVERSPERVTPPCPYASECGGCDLMHCRYEAQPPYKRAILVDLLERQLPPALAELAGLTGTTLAAPEPFGYRQRIRLQLRDGKVGYYRQRSHRLVAIDRCLIAAPSLNSCLSALLAMDQSDHLFRHCQELELLHDPLTQQVTVLLHASRKPRPADLQAGRQLQAAIEPLAQLVMQGPGFPLTTIATSTDDRRLGVSYPDYFGSHLPLTLHWEVGGFCQVNLSQNRQLIQLVERLAAPSADDSVLDLFCGMGNFAISLAHRCHRVTGVEGQGSAIRSARANSEAAGLDNTVFHKADSHQFCSRLAADRESFTIVVADPPRQGMPGLAPLLGRICRERLVLVSCDPATLCRDLGQLAEAGFVVKTIVPVDMFPQTHHLETVVLLEKR